MLFDLAGFHSFLCRHTLESIPRARGLRDRTQRPAPAGIYGYKKRAVENPYSRSRMVLSRGLERPSLGNDGTGRWL